MTQYFVTKIPWAEIVNIILRESSQSYVTHSFRIFCLSASSSARVKFVI